MAVTYVNKVESWQYPYMEYHGLSTDTKPDDAPENSRFIELDTGAEYYFSNDEWSMVGGTIADGSIQLNSLSVVQNGQYNAPSGHAYRIVNVNVPNPSTGTLSITQNGTTDVTAYASVSVNVPDASESDLTKMVERTSSISKLPSGITTVGDYAFSNYNALALTTLPAGITSIGSYAFRNCSNLALTALPDVLTTIGAQAFYGCTSLAISVMPATVTSIGDRAFSSSGLSSLRFTGKPNTINSNAFSSCSDLYDIYVPWSANEVSGAPWGAANATIHYNWTGD